jgi:cytochrome P450
MSLAVSSDIDLFGDEVLAEPYPHYETLRRIGPVVYLERYDLFALPRYAVVKAVGHRPGLDARKCRCRTFSQRYGCRGHQG